MCRRKNLSKPFKSVGAIRSTRKLQLIHNDLVGPMQTEPIGGHKYFVTFIDDYSRWCTVYFLMKKSEGSENMKQSSQISVERILVHCVQIMEESICQDILTSKGISHELTIPHTPQQNAVTERMNRTLQESARAMLAHAGMPNGYWAEAIATAAYLRNRATTSVLQESKTPYEMWCEKKPNISHLRVFGYVAYAYVPDCERQK